MSHTTPKYIGKITGSREKYCPISVNISVYFPNNVKSKSFREEFVYINLFSITNHMGLGQIFRKKRFSRLLLLRSVCHMTDRNIATVRNQILLASRFGLSAILRIKKYTEKPRYEM